MWYLNAFSGNAKKTISGRFLFDKDITIGRSAAAHICPSQPDGVSKIHCTLTPIRPKLVQLRDTSKFGTTIAVVGKDFADWKKEASGSPG